MRIQEKTPLGISTQQVFEPSGEKAAEGEMVMHSAQMGNHKHAAKSQSRNRSKKLGEQVSQRLE